jgi:hypothetical protein
VFLVVFIIDDCFREWEASPKKRLKSTKFGIYILNDAN